MSSAHPIVVGYDVRTADRAPLRFAAAAAEFTGAPLLIASVAEPGDDPVRSAASELDSTRRELAEGGTAVEIREYEHKTAARALHEVAEAEDAALLVVGSTTRGTLGRVLPGSTAERLFPDAPCPVAVVPRGWRACSRLATIGVAFVDTAQGRHALRRAHALARRAKAKLRVLNAIQPRAAAFGETQATVGVQPGKGPTEVEGELRAQAERELSEAIGELDDGVPVTADAFLDEPADALVRVSENLDLLVCGSRGYAPLRAVLAGGVSRRLAADAHCPVIVLPR